jgi:glycosyltransferase involved in cell wall biosynthesis
VLTLSQAAKTDILKHLQLADDQVTVTHLAADERFHPRLGAERDAEVRRKYDLPDRFILYMGGFDVRKRVTQLLHAFTYVSQAEGDEAPLVIAGREPRWGTPMFPDLRALADELKVADFTRWIGYVDEEDKPSLYRLATVFVYPSAYEGFGLPLLEAMACGTPVIANEIPVFEEISGDAVYLTRDGDARAMAGAILAVLGQDSLRETQITRGLAQATNFSWRKAARTTLEVYEKVMAMPAGR